MSTADNEGQGRDSFGSPLKGFEPGVDFPGEPTPSAWWFIFRRGKLLVKEHDTSTCTGTGELYPPNLHGANELGLEPLSRHYMGRLDGVDCIAAEVDEQAETPAGYIFQPLRGLFEQLSEAHFALAGRAVQICEWDRTHRFCGQCAIPTEAVPGERARKCPSCGLSNYPRISPAVIVRVTRASEILLARARNFPGAFYSVLAGFVEPGESLEDTIHREIREEVGLEVTDLRYFGSQPWPYPHSLMIGFTARYASGEIEVDGLEIQHAEWFTPANLPEIPGKLSIARRLIDAYLDGQE